MIDSLDFAAYGRSLKRTICPGQGDLPKEGKEKS
jgi:hypothetical protein